LHSLLLAAAGCTLLTANHLAAQSTESPAPPTANSHWEFLVNSGTLVPTGVQRDAIRRANLTAAQLTYVVRPSFAITSTFDWARSRDVAVADDPKLDVFTYDVGAEVRAPRSMTGESVTFRPFAGAGAGGRSYNYRKLDVDATHDLAAYGSVGGEIGVRRLRVRLEARDYMTEFKPLRGHGTSRSANDVVLMAGLRLISR
ncbi:MAG TPA: hypothetical protein VH277_06360, partial [Gemmatimonadaceae bacterium]|nr:hypothetical protein [Gemmatimonadaceae bacterium]